MSTTIRPGVLERDAERARIAWLLDAAAGGRGGVLAIEGEAGIGKSTLLRIACQGAEDRGMDARLARCVDNEVTFPLAAIAQLVGTDAADIPIGEPVAAEAEYRVFESVRRCVSAVAERAPVALLVDDVHCADPESLRCLAYVARRIGNAPVALMLAARPQSTVADASVLRSVLEDPGVEVVRPRPLSSHAVGKMIAAGLGEAPDPRFLEACVDATGGNPFLVTELLRELALERMHPVAQNAARLADLGPQAVTRSVLLRIGRLGAAAVEVARAVAVLGDGCDAAHAAALAGVPPLEADEALDALSRAGIVRATTTVRFVHPLVGAAIRADLGPSETASMHARAAELLAETGDIDAIAQHLCRTRPRRDRSTVAVLRRAAGHAMVRGVPEVAARLLERAVEEGAPLEDRSALLRELGDARLRLGHPGATTAYAEALEETSDLAEQAAIARQTASALAARGDTAGAVRTLEQALARVGPRDLGLALELHAELVTTAFLEPERLRGLRAVVPGIPRQRPSSPRLSIAASAVRAFFGGLPAEQVVELAERALDGGRLLAEQSPDSPAFHLCVFALVGAQRDRAARAAIDTALDDARRRGSVVGRAFALGGRASVNLASGRLAAAEADARAALDIVRAAGIDQAVPGIAGHLTSALLDRQGPDAAWQALDEWRLTGEPPESVFHSRLLEVRGRVHLAAGRPVEALADFEELGDRARRLSVGPTRWRSGAALAHHALGDIAAAQRLADEGLVAAQAFGAPREIGVALRAVGLVTPGEVGIALLQEAVDVLEPSNARLELARALVDLGAAVRRAGRRTEARRFIQRGQALAQAAGAMALANRAAQELAASGARLRAATAEGLTPAELRVARLAAAGRSNKAIAAELYLSLKTVEIHLTSAYRKLGIRSRRDLADALAELGDRPEGPFSADAGHP